MGRNARNTLSDMGNLKDNEEGIIDCSLIRRLVKLQDVESLSLGNSLNINHIVWQRHKMKVNLAVQTLSSSVANALEFLKDDLKLPEFKGCSPTIQFIRKIDRVFDILNSRNPYGKGFKSPLRHSNISVTESLLSLLTNENQLLVKCRRKAFVLGLIITMPSIVALSKILLQRDETLFKYALTYQFSQDHIEPLFACIRGKGGLNNNPNTLQD